MTTLSSETLHASTVAIDGVAVLIEGRSGAGKSDLALRLIDRGATLVADDYTIVQRHGAALRAIAPANIRGKIEVRGVGIVELPQVDDVPIGLVVRLSDVVARLPESDERRIAGVAVHELLIDPREPSAPIKVELALRQQR